MLIDHNDTARTVGAYAYRKAVDDNAVMTDNALLWLAKQGSGDVLAAE